MTQIELTLRTAFKTLINKIGPRKSVLSLDEILPLGRLSPLLYDILTGDLWRELDWFVYHWTALSVRVLNVSRCRVCGFFNFSVGLSFRFRRATFLSGIGLVWHDKFIKICVCSSWYKHNNLNKKNCHFEKKCVYRKALGENSCTSLLHFKIMFFKHLRKNRKKSIEIRWHFFIKTIFLIAVLGSPTEKIKYQWSRLVSKGEVIDFSSKKISIQRSTII